MPQREAESELIASGGNALQEFWVQLSRRNEHWEITQTVRAQQVACSELAAVLLARTVSIVVVHVLCEW
jgi:hypothetical protein